jgi:hypothetical protein
VYKSSFLFFSVTLAAVAAGLQSGGSRWGDFTFAMKTESRADATSVSEDVRFVRAQAKVAPAVLRMLWSDVRADLKELKADATIETKIAAARLTSRGQ